ncbi:TIGR02281 family clan AA aspartic protease [Novosphingobium colocasiae]
MRVDGHFWVLATINGEQVDFLIDTGATYTGVSSAVARKAGLVPDDDNRGVVLETANGPIAARMATAASIKLGGIDARGLEVAIAPRTGGRGQRHRHELPLPPCRMARGRREADPGAEGCGS